MPHRRSIPRPLLRARPRRPPAYAYASAPASHAHVGYQFGYVFESGPEDRRIKTAAHELGLGRFQLRHTFVPPLEIADTTDNLMSCHPTGTTLCKRQWDYLHDPQWRVFRFLQGEEEGRMEEIDDASAQYVITIYSPYLSVCIEEAFKLPTAKEREVRIYQLLSNAIKNGYLTEEQIKAVKKDIENPKGYAKQIDIPYMSLCEVIVNNNQSNYVVFYLIPGTKIINAKGEWTETKIPYVLTRRVLKSEVLQFGKGYNQSVTVCKNSVLQNIGSLMLGYILLRLDAAFYLGGLSQSLIIWDMEGLENTVVCATIGFGFQFGLGIGVDMGGSMGVARDGWGNYAFFTSAAGFLSYLGAFGGSENPEKGENWYTGLSQTTPLGQSTYTVFYMETVDQLGGDINEFQIAIPRLPGISIELGESFDYKGIGLTFGKPGTPSGLGAGMHVSSTEQLWILTRPDMEKCFSNLCTIGMMLIGYQGDCYLDCEMNASLCRFYARWYDAEMNPLTEITIIQFEKGTKECTECWVTTDARKNIDQASKQK